MIVRRKFKIKAVLTVKHDDNEKITHKEIRPDIDWDVDPIIGVTTNEHIWVTENKVDVLYLHTLVEYDEKDHQLLLDKGWVLIA